MGLTLGELVQTLVGQFVGKDGRRPVKATTPHGSYTFTVTEVEDHLSEVMLRLEPTSDSAERALIPEDIVQILLRSLTAQGLITEEQRGRAWRWVEDRRGPHEEMGQ